jgi:hypothetical protein
MPHVDPLSAIRRRGATGVASTRDWPSERATGGGQPVGSNDSWPTSS